MGGGVCGKCGGSRPIEQVGRGMGRGGLNWYEMMQIEMRISRSRAL